MKLPRDLSGETLVKALKKLGYTVDHQTGVHIRLTTQKQGGHHIIPIFFSRNRDNQIGERGKGKIVSGSTFCL